MKAPYGCLKAVRFANVSPETCQTPDINIGAYRWGFFFAWIWASFIFMFVAMAMMYSGLLSTERKSRKYSFAAKDTTVSGPSPPASRRVSFADLGSYVMSINNKGMKDGKERRSGQDRSSVDFGDLMKVQEPAEQSICFEANVENDNAAAMSGAPTNPKPKMKNSRKFFNQAALYVSFFMITWIFMTIQASLQAFLETGYSYLVVLLTIFTPLQGFFNTLIYVRPRYLEYRKKHPEATLCKSLGSMFANNKN
uniref:Uncharacterized protein n=1 Tax=Grammatophora oceanica TaxID=210454 RepID=A0A7S1YKU2_9STRA|mmetsp:Transcript_8972/g.13111  ORF Transcript_8972/g.13111 Transcript_8972/m.13111 type:complete len:252 (+) Transcript_8972:1-756(+)